MLHTSSVGLNTIAPLDPLHKILKRVAIKLRLHFGVFSGIAAPLLPGLGSGVTLVTEILHYRQVSDIYRVDDPVLFIANIH